MVTARGNSFLRNDTGVLIQWAYPFLQAYPPPDFGSINGNTNDPGRNVFHCNQMPQSRVGPAWGGAVVLDFTEAPLPVTFLFDGNRWDGDPPSYQFSQNGAFTNYADIMSTNVNTMVSAKNPLPSNEPCP